MRAAGCVAAMAAALGVCGGAAAAPTDLSASDAIELVESGRMSCEAYVDALLAQAERYRDYNFFISHDPEAVRAAARAIDARLRAGEDVGRVPCLPVIVKDNLDTDFLPTTVGTPALQHHQPARNAAAVQRLLDQGAIVVGKANMHELALGATGSNGFYGDCHNPYDFTRAPGGSSSGTAGAIAARVVPVGLGSDAAGSIRMPASWSGTVGFRPSAGRYSTDGLALVSVTQDRVGTMARDARDLVLLDRVLSQVGSKVKPAKLHGLRLGVDRANFLNGVDPEIAARFEAALDQLRDRGVEIVEASVMPPDQWAATIGFLRLAIGFYEGPIYFGRYFAACDPPLTMLEVAQQAGSLDVRNFLFAFFVPGAPLAVDAATYQRALGMREGLRAAYAAYMADNDLDAMIFPTTPITALPVGQNVLPGPNGPIPLTLFLNQDAVPAAFAGLPALSMPLGLSAAGLPFGLEIDGLEGGDETVLGIALSLEHVLGHIPPPPQP